MAAAKTITATSFETTGGAAFGDIDFRARVGIFADSLGADFQTQTHVTCSVADPSVTPGHAGNPGSLLMQNDNAGNGALWLKVGPNLTDWRKVALA